MSDFSAIGTALSGMNAARQELDVTGNNIANESTAGYVRESATLLPIGGAPPSMQMPSSGIGQGVAVLGVARETDPYLDAQDLAAKADAAGADQTRSVLSQAQDVFGEPGSSGISQQLSSFWSEWDTVASSPTDPSARTTLVAKASGLVTSLNELWGGLDQVRSDAVKAANTDVAEVNRDAAAVASLNAQIIDARAGGSDPGGLSDQRDALLAKLADVAGVTTRAEPNGAVDVLLGGEPLVDGVNTTPVVTVASASGALTFTWGPGGPPLSPEGRLGALTTAANVTLPGYMARLDTLADRLRDSVNTQLEAGAYWTGVGTAGQSWHAPGGDLFVGSGAQGLSINPAIAADPTQLAISAVPADGSSPYPATDPTGPAADGSNAQIIAARGPTWGADDMYRQLVSGVGTDVSAAMTQAATTATVQGNADAARQSAEGVNLDEELARMTEFQHAYSANAKFMSAVDQTIQDLLAMVG